MVAADLRLSAAEELLGGELESTSAFRCHDFNVSRDDLALGDAPRVFGFNVRQTSRNS